MLGRRPPSDSELLTWAQERVAGLLPDAWEAKPASDVAGRPDLALEIRGPDGTTGRLVFEAKSAAEPKQVASVVEQLRRYEGSPIVVAPFLSKRTRELLSDSAVGYIDMTGNVLLRLNRPALYVRASGQEKNPWLGGRSGRTLRGPKAARIVRLLCECSRELNVTQIAQATKTDTGYVSRVLEVLERDALIERVPRGTIKRVAWEGLIRRWVDDYNVLKSNVSLTYLDPRDLARLGAEVEKLTLRYALTGSFAVPPTLQVAPPRLLMAYVDEPAMIADSLSLKSTGVSANVILLQPFDDVVYERSVRRAGVRYVSMGQLAADLLTGPGRMPEEAEALLAWMRKSELSWRSWNP